METDVELIRKWKEGDEDAFSAMYERYRQTAMRTAWLLCHNLADSEDIVQETFVQCYFHIQELKDESRFRPWMLKCLVRTGWKLMKKQKKEMPEEQMELHLERERYLESTFSGKTSGEPLEEAIAREFSGELTKAVRRLSEKHRLVIVLYYYDELSVHEIAKITGCLEGTVKSRLHFARRQLKKMLSDAGEEETGRIIYERG
ncbi:MAG TPA: RNA polymerase sigma factor [Candidatus Anaerobutyricum stercoris]|uniref:RNA polymerase sigma factor n=1 Tax=Candidatus Anaerobutyricum stercoris TaxID=2838457 RepID=A0A9D2EJ50_9FIRM|nr:RNA polymerase sigma factor [Eubacterium sp. An3]OUO29468.1 hypothetical protein B5F87_02885 [Eubacterium sp. An3]CVI69296.1 ECF RNA polymerase sigma factor SigW [Eubacteriaceae bacterium CHKCI004]HIZ38569.1 RNA polymerase sigma factor [Candidatus Anaerobutyricum stercoris]